MRLILISAIVMLLGGGVLIFALLYQKISDNQQNKGVDCKDSSLALEGEIRAIQKAKDGKLWLLTVPVEGKQLLILLDPCTGKSERHLSLILG